MIKRKLLKPTESEIEILSILWNKKKATVREVHEDLSSIKDAGYTTTLKLMQIMFEKKLVDRDDRSKTHIYSPAVTKEKNTEAIPDEDDRKSFFRLINRACNACP